jgi:ATP-binding protein involved in chromosome partitioning
MAIPDKDRVLATLDKVIDPKTGRGLVAAGLVQGLMIGEGRAGFMMEVPAEDAEMYAYMRDAAEKALKGVPAVEKAQVVLTAAARALAPGATRVRKGARVADDPRTDPAGKPPPTAFEHVKRVIAVVSGKGGVGKSTVAVNLACAFAAMGLRAGLLDCDVYGPSVPRMMGIDDEPVFEDGKLTPLTAHGLKLMSIGFIVDEGRAMIWRGPMVTSAVRQMIKDVRWGGPGEPLDMLVVDMPPGTGDIQLTLFHDFKIDGAVIVSTPQEIALIDARRAAAMLEKLARRSWAWSRTWPSSPTPPPARRSRSSARAARGPRRSGWAYRCWRRSRSTSPCAVGGDEGMPVVVSDPGGAVGQAFAEAARALAG